MERPQLGLRMPKGYSFLQPSDGTKAEDGPGIVSVAGFEGDGYPELSCRVRKCDTGRRDADDLAVDAVDQDFSAKDVGIGAEVLLPIAVAQDNDAILTSFFFCRRKRTAQGGPDTKRVEKVGADGAAKCAVRYAAIGDVVLGVEGVAGDGGEGSGAALIFANPAFRKAEVVGLRVDLRQAAGVGKRQRLKQDGVEHTEDGGIGADTESESEDSDGGEAGATTELAQSVVQILQESLHRLFPISSSVFVGLSRMQDAIQIG